MAYYCEKEKLDDAWLTIERAKADWSAYPTKGTLMPLLHTYCLGPRRLRSVEMAKHVWSLMERSASDDFVSRYSRLLHALVANGEIDEAMAVYENVFQLPFVRAHVKRNNYR